MSVDKLNLFSKPQPTPEQQPKRKTKRVVPTVCFLCSAIGEHKKHCPALLPLSPTAHDPRFGLTAADLLEKAEQLAKRNTCGRLTGKQRVRFTRALRQIGGWSRRDVASSTQDESKRRRTL